MTDEATPRPWYFSPWHIEEGPSAVRAGSSPAADYICTTASDANAALIVRAVNTFSEREALLREAAEELQTALSAASKDLIARIKAALGDSNDKG